MRKLIACTGLAALALAVPAQAKPGHAGKPAHAGKQGVAKNQSKGKRCAPKTVGFNARGLLVSHTLTQTAGADTPADTGDDRYSGDVVVNVTKANHGFGTGEKTFTLANGRVKFADANGDGTAEQPSAGDRVKVHGKVTRLNKRCDTAGFTSAVTVKQVQFKAPEAPAPAPTPSV